MWKNIFIESCILSALIFGGFYLNATVQNEIADRKTWEHISGYAATSKVRNTQAHLSGASADNEPDTHISGVPQPQRKSVK